MSRGYDVAELLAEIKEHKEDLARILPHSFTEPELRLVIAVVGCVPCDTLSEIRDAAAPVMMSVRRKLQAAYDRIEASRGEAANFIGSLTDEERQLILDRRAKGRQP